MTGSSIRLLHATTLAFALIFSLPSAYADENTQTETKTEEVVTQPQAGTRGDKMESQSNMNKEAKEMLAPHSLMISSNLHSALDQVKGLKSQLEVATSPSSKKSMEHIRSYRKEIKDDIAQVSAHQQQLQAGIKKFPDLAQADEFRAVTTALNEVKEVPLLQMEGPNYWSNKEQAKSDLDRLETRLQNAIDKTKDFNSKKLDVKSDVS